MGANSTPNGRQLSVKITEPVLSADITVTDILGREVFYGSFSGNKFVIPSEGFAGGVYYVVVRSGKDIRRGSFVRE